MKPTKTTYPAKAEATLRIIIITIILYSILPKSYSVNDTSEGKKLYKKQVSEEVIDTAYIDALPEKPIVSRQALERAMRSASPEKQVIRYDLLLISVLTIVLYIISIILINAGIISNQLHRKIWNVILFLMFIISVAGGFLIVILMNYDIRLSCYRELMFWHVEAGIAMTLIGIFHIYRHRFYFTRIFGRGKDE